MPQLADNKKAFFDYEILEKFEAGLMLLGHEVKSAKNGQISLKGAFITFHNNKAYLTNATISKYKQAGKLDNYDPTRSRQVLLHKKEIRYLQGKFAEKGLTIVPISVYTKNRLVKIEIAVARGKHTFDKRETLKKKDVEREMRRSLHDK
ncbi:MAG TPA: SsrA-binding protein SmpB [Candidatus Magasanikbacteria bacterium]|nr:SsrA-binding protein SmpB [Candidatus Magasanikbacteria bacterium]